MKKSSSDKGKIFRKIWDKYNDTLWKMEQSWNDSARDYDKRATLTDSVVEMIRIERKLKAIEARYEKG